MALPGAILAFCILTSFYSVSGSPNAAVFTMCYIAAGLACAASVWLESPNRGSFPLAWVLGVAIACRVILLPFGPLFDNDVYRYLWDGHVAANGINPFLYPPSSEHLLSLRTPYFGLIGYPEIGTIYPPFAQIIFLLAAKLNLTTPASFKLLLIPFDLGTIYLVALLLKRFQKPLSLVMLYAWSPLVLKEFSNSAHIDVVMIFFIMLALYLALLKRQTSAGAALALAVMTKGVAVVLAPVLATRRSLRLLAGILVVLAVLAIPYVSAGDGALSGASAYMRYWRFNDGAFYLFYLAEQALSPNAQAPYAKVAVAAVLLAYVLVLVRRRPPKADEAMIAACRNVVAALLLLTPVLDPWYVCWLVPFLCLSMNGGMLALCILAPISYLYYQSNTFPDWIRVVEYAPVYALLAWEVVRARRGDRRSAPSSQ